MQVFALAQRLVVEDGGQVLRELVAPPVGEAVVLRAVRALGGACGAWTLPSSWARYHVDETLCRDVVACSCHSDGACSGNP